MRNHLLRIAILGMVTSFLVSGCMLCRGVDRAFLGATTNSPTHPNRKGTGLFLLPLAFVLDVVTFPIQGLLIVIIGDDFPYSNTANAGRFADLNNDPQFQRLSGEQRAFALIELKALLQSGTVPANSVLALSESGHWVPVHVTAKERATLLARAKAATPEMLVLRGAYGVRHQ